MNLPAKPWSRQLRPALLANRLRKRIAVRWKHRGALDHERFSEGHDFQVQAYYDSANRHEPNSADIRGTTPTSIFCSESLALAHHVSWGFGVRAARATARKTTTGLYFDPNTRTDQLYTAFLQRQHRPRAQSPHISRSAPKSFCTPITPAFESEPSAQVALDAYGDAKPSGLPRPDAVRTPFGWLNATFYLSGYVGRVQWTCHSSPVSTLTRISGPEKTEWLRTRGIGV